MITHIFKLVWNKKWKSLLIILEIFFSFIVLFWISSVVIYSYNNYLSPLGFSFDKVYYLAISSNDPEEKVTKETLRQTRLLVSKIPDVEGVTFVGNAPFVSWSGKAVLNHEGIINSVYKWEVDEKFKDVMDIRLLKGRWFAKSDEMSNTQAIVVTQDLEEKFFGKTSGIGKTINNEGESYKIIGISEKVRDDVLSLFFPGYFIQKDFETADIETQCQLLVKTNSNNIIDLEEKILNKSNNLVKKGSLSWEANGEPLQSKYSRQLSNSIFQFTLVGIVCGFLILNVVLGLFGVFWLNISRRRSELGLRKAIGALNVQIYGQMIGEAFALTTLALVPAIIIAVQIPLLNILPGIPTQVFTIAILVSIFIIYSIVAICAFYPSRVGSKIQPAFALREE